jgi:serine/threonine protein kinase
MPEPKPPGAPESPAHHPTGDEAPAPDVVHGEIVFPQGAEPADDAPTIISKKVPARNGPSGQSADSLVGGSLRGRTLAHFELIEPIGVGGMAAVIRARDRQLDRPVALKILPPEMASDAENVLRFHQEARAAAKLDHENIARVFFCGEDQRLHFIAFEFVEGVNLRTLLEKRGRLPVHEAVHFMLQIATGLAHAAARGVVHRDIKPSNIIISPNGRAKLVDMGLARNMGPQSDRDLTQSGVTLGTFDYIAPEQAMDPREADVRSDIYSLGCTFYHMLTGQAPVPEGTAAKKLHHHQHVAPVDPRQLNPNIPDDVAAILQRMMAKDPRERYQRAEHLVQHLIQVAQKLGAVTDVPDGVLFVDAPLPAPPRKRPLFMAAVGALMLGVLLIVLSLAPGRPGSPRPTHAPPNADFRPLQAINPPPVPDGKKPETPPAGNGQRVVKDEQGLRAAFAEKLLSVSVVLEGSFTIDRSVTFTGEGDRTALVRSRDPQKPAVIRIRPDLAAGLPDPWGGLQINGGTVTFRDVIFEIEINAKAATPETLVAGVLVKGAGTAIFEGCTFTQPNAPTEALTRPKKSSLVPFASVAVWNPGLGNRDRAGLTFKECYFKRGQAAVSIRGNAYVRPTDCAFGPHVTLFHLRGDENPKLSTRLDLTRVSALLAYGPAFRLDKGAGCDLRVKQSIFSCPNPEGDAYDLPDLIIQTGTPEGSVRYFGYHNAYHYLNVLWSRTTRGGSRTDTWDIFRSEVKKAGGSEESSNFLALSESPWAAQPFSLKAAEESPIAFRVDPVRPELRDSEDPLMPIGVRKCAGVQVALPLPALAKVTPAAPAVARKPNEKVVDPDDDGRTPGVYRTLAAAVADAKDGDVILIRHNGPTEVGPVNLEVAQRLTIRPDEGYKPVLTLHKKRVEEVALFTFYHGHLRFEELGFLFTPNSSKLQAVVALKGNGQCVFNKCVVTLEPSAAGAAPLSLVALSESTEAMKMMAGSEAKPMPNPMPQTAPEIVLEKCFVRGEGDLLAVRPSRPFALRMSNSLAVLYGSLVNVEGNAGELTGAAQQITLTRTTTYLQQHLVSLRGKTGKGLVYTEVSADECLFAAAAGKSLVHIEGPDTEDQMRGLFRWSGSRNIYSGFDKVLEQQSGADSGMSGRLGYDQDRWKRFSNETDPEPRFVQMKFAVPESDHPFSQALPEQFRATRSEPQVDFERCGAPIEQLPTPYTPGTARPDSGAPHDEQPRSDPEDSSE